MKITSLFMNRVIFQKLIFREDLRNNPEVCYLFGDNLARVGLGGQAKEMRNEPNAYGIATKKSPSEYFTDDEYNQNIVLIEQDIKRIPKNRLIVVPSDGIGTGLARLSEVAPKTFNFLQIKLMELFNSEI